MQLKLNLKFLTIHQQANTCLATFIPRKPLRFQKTQEENKLTFFFLFSPLQNKRTTMLTIAGKEIIH